MTHLCQTASLKTSWKLSEKKNKWKKQKAHGTLCPCTQVLHMDSIEGQTRNDSTTLLQMELKERGSTWRISWAAFSASSLQSPCRGLPASPHFHLEFSGLIEELRRRVYYRLRNDPFHIWSSKELLVRSLWVHLSHMWSFLQNQYGYFSVWQVNMKYHIIIEKQSCTFKHTQYSYLWQSLQLLLMDILEYV